VGRRVARNVRRNNIRHGVGRMRGAMPWICHGVRATANAAALHGKLLFQGDPRSHDVEKCFNATLGHSPRRTPDRKAEKRAA
jgi:hypothetical protein